MMFRPGMAAASCSGLLCAALAAVPASAQLIPQATLEAKTDLRERGLSWSNGKPAIGISATLPVHEGLAFDLEAFTLRNSARHGGADLGIAMSPSYSIRTGGWELAAGVCANLFAGRSRINYIELTGSLSHTLGPAQLTLGAAIAPPQEAIGGSNVYIDAQVSTGIPGTPFTLYGGVGHTTGARKGARAARLRPGGNYVDHLAGVEYTMARLAAGVRYSGTSIRADEINPIAPFADSHYGGRLSAYVRIAP